MCIVSAGLYRKRVYVLRPYPPFLNLIQALNLKMIGKYLAHCLEAGPALSFIFKS